MESPNPLIVKNAFVNINPEEYRAFIEVKEKLYEVDFTKVLRENGDLRLDCVEMTVRRRDDLTKSITHSLLDDEYINQINRGIEAHNLAKKELNKHRSVVNYDSLTKDHLVLLDDVQGHAIAKVNELQNKLSEINNSQNDTTEVREKIEEGIKIWSSANEWFNLRRSKLTDKPFTTAKLLSTVEFFKKNDEIKQVCTFELPEYEMEEKMPTFIERMEKEEIRMMTEEEYTKNLFCWYFNDYSQAMNLTEGSSASYDEDVEKCRNDIETMKKQIEIYEKLLRKYAKQERNNQVENVMKNIKDSTNANIQRLEKAVLN